MLSSPSRLILHSMRFVLAPERPCPSCGCVDVRETRHRLAAWERLFALRRYRCQGCWRRLLVFRHLNPRPEGRIYNRG